MEKVFELSRSNMAAPIRAMRLCKTLVENNVRGRKDASNVVAKVKRRRSEADMVSAALR